MAKSEVERQIELSGDLITLARAERESLQRQIEESQKLIEHSREIIARLDKLMAGKR
jgi:hypothetical protein